MTTEALKEQYFPFPREADPQLHDHYSDSLLKPGWAGELNPQELAYIKGKLKASSSLRRKWRFRTTRISDALIRKVAMEGVEPRQKTTDAGHTPSETKLLQKIRGRS